MRQKQLHIAEEEFRLSHRKFFAAHR